MKKTLLISACIIMAACSNTANPKKDATSSRETASASDEAAIRKVIKDMTFAKSPKDMAASFTEDAEWIIVGQAPYKGRANIEKGIAAIMTADSKLVFDSAETKEVIVFNDHQALAKTVAVYHREVGGKAEASKRNEFADYFVKSADGVWRVAYEINSDSNG